MSIKFSFLLTKLLTYKIIANNVTVENYQLIFAALVFVQYNCVSMAEASLPQLLITCTIDQKHSKMSVIISQRFICPIQMFYFIQPKVNK